jgi:virginiamycin B lyase
MIVATADERKVTFDLGSTSPGCSESQTNGRIDCSKKIDLPAGSQNIVVTLYDRRGGRGDALSSATTKIKIVTNKVTTVQIVTDGIPATATVLLGDPGASSVDVPQDTPTSVPASVSAYDAKGNLIVPPGPYALPITLEDSDTSGATHLSKTTVKASGVSLKIKYDGSDALGSATITPSISGRAQSSGAATLSVVAPTITEYSLPASQNGGVSSWPSGITLGSDGALWFTQNLNNAVGIGRITTSGTITNISAPPGSDSIVTGPDGALWYRTSASNAIVRLTTSGTVTEYSLPNNATGLGTGNTGIGLITGPGSVLWSIDQPDSLIGTVTTSGTFTLYPIPTPSANPSTTYTNTFGSITVGPDGALWFGYEVQANSSSTVVGSYVDRMTTAGVITAQFPISSSSNGAEHVPSITTGPDGALWFSVSGAVDGIDRMTTSGSITTYQTSGIPLGIMNGPDGALWFAEFHSPSDNIIGRITTSGTITEYEGPNASSAAAAIAAGPDDALWFTDFRNNAIGRVPLSIAASNADRRRKTERR